MHADWETAVDRNAKSVSLGVALGLVFGLLGNTVWYVLIGGILTGARALDELLFYELGLLLCSVPLVYVAVVSSRTRSVMMKAFFWAFLVSYICTIWILGVCCYVDAAYHGGL